MKLNKKINSWIFTSITEIILAFTIGQIVLFQVPGISNVSTFWNMGLLYLMLIFGLVFFIEFSIKINNASNDSNMFVNMCIAVIASLSFGFLLAVNVYSWDSTNIAMSLILVLLFSLIIIFLYTWFNFEIHIRRNDKVNFKKEYTRLSMPLFLKFFFTSWVYYDDIVFTNLDKLDLNLSHSLVITNNFVYSITLAEKGNETISFVKDAKETRLNKEVNKKEKNILEYFDKVALDNAEDVLINLVVFKDEHYSPVIKGKPDRKLLISPLNGITKKILDFEKTAGDLDKLTDRDYLMDVIKEDRI